MNEPAVNLKRLKLLFFLTVLIVCSWYYSPGTWNAHVRYDSIYTLVEDGTLCIDKYITKPKKNINTGDWAYKDGHYYSTKAPGSMFVGAIAHAPFYWLTRLAGWEHSLYLDLGFAWWINFWVGPVPTALGALCFLLLLLELQFSPRRALFWGSCYALATPLWPYSTQLWGHPLAAAGLMAGLYFLWRPARPKPILAGLALGLAVLADYGAALALPFIALPLLRERAWKRGCLVVLGGVAPCLLFMWYHWACFGNPVTIGNAYANPIFLQSEGAGGMMTRFRSLTLWQLLFGLRRGLFWSTPIALLALPGCAAMWENRRRCEAIALAAIPLVGMIANAAYGFWTGGATAVARFEIYAVPAWMLLAAHFRMETKLRRGIAALLAAVSFSNMLVVANTSPILHEDRVAPIYQDAYWMTYCNQAWNRSRSRGTRLYHWDRETKYFSQVCEVSPGRRWFGHTPWSDLALLLPLLAALTAAAWRFASKATPEPSPPEASSELTETPASGRSLWRRLSEARRFVFPLLGVALLFFLPGIIPWGAAQSELVQPCIEGVFATQSWCTAPAQILYQIIIMLYPSPAAIALLKALLIASTSAAAIAYAAKLHGWDRLGSIALLLLLPAWWFTGRNVDSVSFALPLLLTAFAALSETSWRRRVLVSITALVPLIWLFWPSLLPREVIPAGNHGFKPVIEHIIASISTINFAEARLPEIFTLMPKWCQAIWSIGEVFTACAALALLCAGILRVLRHPRQYPGMSAALLVLATTAVITARYRPPYITGGVLLMAPALLLVLHGWSLLRNWRLAGSCTGAAFLSVCAATIISFSLAARATGGNDAPSYGSTLAEQWQIAERIVKYEDDGHDIALSYRTAPAGPQETGFDLLILLAEITHPYDQLHYPELEDNPMHIAIHNSKPRTGKLHLIVTEFDERLFSPEDD